MKSFLAVFIASAVSVGSTSATEALPVLRKAAPLTFKLPGGVQKSLSDFQGKVIALEFIQTTCPHCQAASHVLTKLQKEFGSRGFQAIDLAINTTNESDISSFMLAQQTDFLVGWIDLYQMGKFLELQAGMRFTVPQVVLIDRADSIRFATPQTGDETATEESTLRSRIVSLLGKR